MTANSLVTDDLTQKFWQTKLDRKVENGDIFSGYTGEVRSDGSLPNAIVVKSKQTGKTKGTIGLLLPLKEAGQTGRDPLSTFEEELEVLDFTVYANEFKHGVKIPRFGIDHVANTPYDLLSKGGTLLAEYMEKYIGTHRREALNQRFSSNTTVAPSSTTQHINSNFFVAGVASASQPAYSDTLATYKANINTVVPNTALAANRMTPAVMKELESHVRLRKKLRPFDDGMYIVTVPGDQKRILMDEDSGLLKHFSQSSQPEKALKGWIGSYGKFHFVEDLRSPTLLTDDAGTDLTWTYTSVDDSRPTPGADVWDVGYVFGKGSIFDFEAEKMHYERDLTEEYGRIDKLGAFANYGQNVVEYPNGTDVRVNQGSIVVIYATTV